MLNTQVSDYPPTPPPLAQSTVVSISGTGKLQLTGQIWLLIVLLEHSYAHSHVWSAVPFATSKELSGYNRDHTVFWYAGKCFQIK